MFCTHDTCRLAGARLIYWAVLVATIVGVGVAHGQERRGIPAPKLEPFAFTWDHTSDVLRGPPFLRAEQGCEPTTDFLGSGVTLVWRKVELDLAQGFKVRDFWCGKPYRQKTESGTHLAIRIYAWRK